MKRPLRTYVLRHVDGAELRYAVHELYDVTGVGVHVVLRRDGEDDLRHDGELRAWWIEDLDGPKHCYRFRSTRGTEAVSFAGKPSADPLHPDVTLFTQDDQTVGAFYRDRIQIVQEWTEP